MDEELAALRGLVLALSYEKQSLERRLARAKEDELWKVNAQFEAQSYTSTKVTAISQKLCDESFAVVAAHRGSSTHRIIAAYFVEMVTPWQTPPRIVSKIRQDYGHLPELSPEEPNITYNNVIFILQDGRQECLYLW